MCDSMEDPQWMKASLNWHGWHTTVETLLGNQSSTWEMKTKAICRKDMRGRPLSVLGHHIYMSNAALGVLARFTVDKEDHWSYNMDFMINRKQYGHKSIRIEEVAATYGEEDIATLFALIEELQKSYTTRKKRPPSKDLPMAEIIKLYG